MNINQNNTYGNNNVYMGAPQRNLDDASKKTLLAELPTKRTVTIHAVTGNAESIKFAEEVRLFLINEGYQVSQIVHTQYWPTRFGQTILPSQDGGYDIQIGVIQEN